MQGDSVDWWRAAMAAVAMNSQSQTRWRLTRSCLCWAQTAYAATIARCYVQADSADVLVDAERIVRDFNAMPGDAGAIRRDRPEGSRPRA